MRDWKRRIEKLEEEAFPENGRPLVIVVKPCGSERTPEDDKHVEEIVAKSADNVVLVDLTKRQRGVGEANLDNS